MSALRTNLDHLKGTNLPWCSYAATQTNLQNSTLILIFTSTSLIVRNYEEVDGTDLRLITHIVGCTNNGFSLAIEEGESNSWVLKAEEEWLNTFWYGLKGAKPKLMQCGRGKNL